MARLSFCAVLLLMSFSPHDAVEARSKSDLTVRCGGVFDLCIYVDRETGEQAIEGEFERAFGFSEGRAPVRINGLYGFIDQSGAVVVKPAFDFAVGYEHGLAVVKVDGRVGVIDGDGDFVVKPQFALASVLSPEILLVQGPRRVVSGGFTMAPPSRSLLDAFNRKSVGLFHITEGWITDTRYCIQPFDRENGGMVWAAEASCHRGSYGLLRADGTWQVEPSYSHVRTLSEGLAVVCKIAPDSSDGRNNEVCGAVDHVGNLVVPTIYEWLRGWSDGFSATRKDGQHGLVDQKGHLVGGRYYEAIEHPFDDGDTHRIKKAGVWYGVLPNGRLIDVPQVTLQERATAMFRDRPPRAPRPKLGNLDCKSGARIFRDGGKWGIKDPDGQIIIEATHSAIDCFHDGVAWAPVEATGQWCPVGPDGVVRDKPNCAESYSAIRISHHGPERLHEDRFKSSVLWMQAFLAYGADPTLDPPKLIGDGVMGRGKIQVRCRSLSNCD